jgi:hypothetical protein
MPTSATTGIFASDSNAAPDSPTTIAAEKSLADVRSRVRELVQTDPDVVGVS